MADNTGYPGNAALPPEAREKILSTFRHSLNLFKSGKKDDCAVGCDFILKMDPRFSPAKQLLDKVRNPSSTVDVAQLESLVAGTMTTQEKFSAVAPDKLMIEAIEAYAAREFDHAVQSAEKILSVLPGNKDATEILEKARRKKEAQPLVENFRQRALFALEQGQKDEARRNLDMMRSLDPEHPSVEALAQKLGPAPGQRPTRPPGFAAAAPVSNDAFSQPQPGAPPAFDFSAPAAATVPDFSAPAGNPFAFDAAPPAAPAAPPSFDFSAPAAPPPSPPSSGADFSDLWTVPAPEASSVPSPAFAPAPAAPAPASPEVEKLLRDGDGLAAQGNAQGAIETWSRIFLIDLNNADATARIEKARASLADGNRRVSDALKAGRSAFESGKLKEAREKFLEVLAVDADEPTARSFLNRIEEDLNRGHSPYDLSGRSAGSDILADEELSSLPGAERSEALEPSGPRPVAARKTPGLPIIAGILVVAIATGLFFVLKPKSGSASPPARTAGSPLAEAAQLIGEGKEIEARDILQKIPVADPQYSRAQKMMAGISGGESGTPASVSPAAVTSAAPPAGTTDAAAKRAEAESALASHRYIDALTAFNMCSSAFLDDPQFKQEMSKATEMVQAISPAVKLYNDGDYDTAMPILWRLYQQDHDNADVKSYLVRGYYNQGVIALQSDQFEKASQSFSEAIGVAPGDELASRQKAFAERYHKRSPDLLARIYVKYLRPRP